jgi:hypothetical protein
MQFVEARKSTVVDFAAYRRATTGRQLDQVRQQHCDAADNAAWYHSDAIREERT